MRPSSSGAASHEELANPDARVSGLRMGGRLRGAPMPEMPPLGDALRNAVREAVGSSSDRDPTYVRTIWGASRDYRPGEADGPSAVSSQGLLSRPSRTSRSTASAPRPPETGGEGDRPAEGPSEAARGQDRCGAAATSRSTSARPTPRGGFHRLRGPLERRVRLGGRELPRGPGPRDVRPPGQLPLRGVRDDPRPAQRDSPQLVPTPSAARRARRGPRVDPPRRPRGRPAADEPRPGRAPSGRGGVGGRPDPPHRVRPVGPDDP